MGMLSVRESVDLANALHGHEAKKHNSPCPRCHADLWRCRHGIDPKYKSEWNPGEYCEFTCVNCGYSWEIGC